MNKLSGHRDRNKRKERKKDHHPSVIITQQTQPTTPQNILLVDAKSKIYCVSKRYNSHESNWDPIKIVHMIHLRITWTMMRASHSGTDITFKTFKTNYAYLYFRIFCTGAINHIKHQNNFSGSKFFHLKACFSHSNTYPVILGSFEEPKLIFQGGNFFIWGLKYIYHITFSSEIMTWVNILHINGSI